MEKEMATHSSVLVWRIPGTVEPGGLPSMGSHRVGHDWSDLAAAAAGFPSVASGKESTCQCKRCGFDLWVGKITLSKKWYPNLQYSCLENSMGRGAWQATVHGTAKSQTRLSNCIYTVTYISWKSSSPTAFDELGTDPNLWQPLYFSFFLFFCFLTCLFNL